MENVKKETQKKAPVKKPVLTNAATVRLLGVQEHKDRKALVQHVIKYLKEHNVTKNNKGYVIDEKHLLQELSAIIRDKKKKISSLLKIFKKMPMQKKNFFCIF